MTRFSIICSILLAALFFHECQRPQPVMTPVNFQPAEVPYKTLSEYAFFSGDMKRLQPNERVLPYDLITPLFSDYAFKARFVWMPDTVQSSVNSEGIIEFPDHTVLIKNFYYPVDFRQPEKNWEVLETRLLIKRTGRWEAFAYVWNDEQTEARLNIIGDFLQVSWMDVQGKKQAIEYVVPNKNQCKSCHNSDNRLEPIGLKIRNVNRPEVGRTSEFASSHPDAGTSVHTRSSSPTNQLTLWQQAGILAPGDYITRYPPLANFEDPNSGSVEARALAYLDVNCGHCHQPKGPAHTTGLYLTVDYLDQKGKLGFCKTPVAAGKGSGGRKFGIVPGQPDSSILVFRMESSDPGIMMPELGRVIKHEEGIALVREWIAGLEGGCW